MDTILAGEYAASWETVHPCRSVRLLNWNVDRGHDLPGITDFLHRQRPDVCVLQEVDLNAKRTGRRNVADELAFRLGFNYVYGVEFVELSQGSETEYAFHGQAVLARRQIQGARVLRFRNQSDFWRPRWYLPHWPMFQPRKGGRMALIVELDLGLNRLVIYDVHLESRGDERLRLWQLTEVVEDSRQYSSDTVVVIAGDLNTRITPSALRQYLITSGFADACEARRCVPTKPNGQTLDWIYTRGPAATQNTTVHREIEASDHFPMSTSVVLTG